ncbi:hypothetical protein [Novosphingobium resinovorum]|uniref:hypothetical protein n=1 Tax=Novosphingobium resinovorum TaxID=158500 RepID=UPI002ED3F504|nr:hypothetical protein [Novosphingobium resinovorum]
MRSDADRAVTGYQPGSPRQRLISSLLSAAIIIIALLIAIYQTAVAPALKKKASNPVTFNIEGEDADSGAKSPEKAKQADTPQKEQPQRQEVKVETPVPPVEKPVTPTEKPAFSFLKVSRSDMAAADIGAMKQSGSGSPKGGGGGGSTYGPGEGPGGATLYNADWYKEPSDAQLGGYVPANAPSNGWGMVACQTIEHYRVENCQILGESPRGSGFGRAVLNAAWQFQVIPPRINGKPQVGEWVRIRIQYGVRASTG